MAKSTVQVVSKFRDIAGNTQLSKMFVEKRLSGTNLDMAAINADITSVLDPMEELSKLQYVQSKLVVPLDVNTTGLKTSAEANSHVREQGAIVFISERGDSGRPTKATIFIPSPKTSILVAGGTKINLTEIQTQTNALKTNALTADGRLLSVVSESFVRQR